MDSNTENKNKYEDFTKKFSIWYDKNYKLLLFVPLILLFLSLAYLGYYYSQNGEFVKKDISLTGGTSITINGKIVENFDSDLKNKFPEISIRRLSNLQSDGTGSIIIETSLKPEEITPEIEELLGYKLNENNSNIEFTGSSLSSTFYNQLIFALIISFILMSLVVFFLFRSFIPSIAVILASFADIIMPLALINILGMNLSAAGIAAFLMLIGYSVDTDILLTTRALKRLDIPINRRIYEAFKTGLLMTTTALIAVFPIFFFNSGLPESFRQIFIILFIGLVADILNTWMTNASLIKWYCEVKKI